ncbi:uncharacterized protein LOC132624097 [Lycium barbarum]|uniref:uncharacterized protein LOC132624097 n=1 Tax=Lycium barbarum TaxID=112863 RepID=UPI00293ED8D4|nr:uncharacterized protein LOC132624097 [Lycium barbarum]
MQAMSTFVEEFRVRNETESEFFVQYDRAIFSCPENGECLKEKGDDPEKLEKAGKEKEVEYSAAPEDDEFEFNIVAELSPISADEIFYNGMIRPIFKRDDAIHVKNGSKNLSATPASFLIETTSSGINDLEGIPSGTYCIWRPRAKAESPGHCKKSNSPGSSKRLKFRDFLQRSNSNSNNNDISLF